MEWIFVLYNLYTDDEYKQDVLLIFHTIRRSWRPDLNHDPSDCQSDALSDVLSVLTDFYSYFDWFWYARWILYIYISIGKCSFKTPMKKCIMLVILLHSHALARARVCIHITFDMLSARARHRVHITIEQMLHAAYILNETKYSCIVMMIG